jgi:predicted O-methyltransferase YrrM
MIFFRTITYLKYLILSGQGSGHGIHSPFVYDIVSRVFRNKIDIDVVNNVEIVRRRLISDTRVIKVHDLGAGAKCGKNKDERRKVTDIARYSSIPGKYGILLSNLAKEFGKPYILELGTSLGISAMYMALNCPDTIIHTIEGCTETAGIAAENFEIARIENITIHNGSFDERLPAILDSTAAPGLVFIDGNHRKDPFLKYFSLIADKSDSNTVVIADDIYLSGEMKEAWEEIKNNAKVTVTIDLHRMGIAFFRKGINRNHFVVRY